MTLSEVVVSGLPVESGLAARGPVELADGSWLVTQPVRESVWKIDAEAGTASLFGQVSGMPTAAIPTSDGGAVIARKGRLIRLTAAGACSEFGAELANPTDLAVAPDGTLWIAEAPSQENCDGAQSSGRLLRIGRSGSAEGWADGLEYPSGLARLSDGSWLVTDGPGLVRVFGPGRIDRASVIDVLPSPGHGLCLDEDDNAYVAGSANAYGAGSANAYVTGSANVGVAGEAAGPCGAVHVVSAEGAIVDTLRSPVGDVITDCAFVGPGRRTLAGFVAGSGAIVVWEGMPVAGQPQTLFELPPQ